MSPIQRAVKRMIKKLPLSIRAIARQAGLSHVKLYRAARGEGTLTAKELAKVVGALRRFSDEAEEMADLLEEAQRQEASDADQGETG